MTVDTDLLHDEIDSADDTSASKSAQESIDIRRLREKAKAYDAAVIRADNAERKLTIQSLGIDVSTGTGKLFLDAVTAQGLTSSEDIARVAVEYGITTASSEQDQQANESAQAQTRIAQAAHSGGAETVKSTITPADAAQWPLETWLRFSKEHPHLAEELKRENEVTNPGGF
jgi:hypothetical protein